MKKVVLILSVFLLVSSAALAQTDRYGRIGLYADSVHTANEVWNPGGMHEFTLYIFCLPGSLGMMCAEFAVDYPANIIAGDVTENPGVSVSLGELETGMSFCFLECQEDWVWTHSQVLYLTDTNPSQISIVEHGLSGEYQLANCLENFPTEPCFYSPSLCLNTSCPPDMDPPDLVDADAVNSIQVTVTFNENLFAATAEEESNYEVFETANPGNTLAVGSANLLLDPTTVQLTLGTSMVGGALYTLRAGGVCDIAGNEMSPGSEVTFTGIDTDPPNLVDVVAETGSTLLVTFSERVTEATAEQTTNYGISDDGLSPDIHFSSAELQADGMTVRLNLTRNLMAGHVYTLYVGNIKDLSGNTIPTPSSRQFVYGDEIPPELLSARAGGYTLIEVTFNEPLDSSTAGEPGNYEVFETDDTSSTIAVSSAQLSQYVDSAVVALGLSDSMVNGVTYTVRVSNVEDVSGNAIAPGSEAAFAFHDTFPPGIAGASALNFTLVELLFDEPLDSLTAQAAANYEVFETAEPSNTIEITEAELQGSGLGVRLTLGDSLSESVSYTVRVSNVEDIWGNPVPPGSEVAFILPDTTPPGLAGVNVIHATSMEVSFSEPVGPVTAENTDNYLLFETGSPQDSIAISGAELQGDGITVGLSLGSPLTFGVSYTLRVSGVMDLAGNPIAPGSEIVFTPQDTFPPELLQASPLSDSVIKLIFNEPMDSVTARTAANYEVFETADTSSTIGVVTAVLHENGTDVSLSLGSSLLLGTSYTVRVNGVEDIAGNPVPPGSSKSFVFGGVSGCIGLYSDELHSNWCVNGTGFYMVEMWIWCRPSIDGQICAEFAVGYPANVIQSTVTANDDIISVTLGELPIGMSVCYTGCQYEWNWPFHQTLFVVDSTPTTVEIIAHPDVGEYHLINCVPGSPEETDICASLLVNCDDVPPEILGVDVISTLLLDVAFSEPVSCPTACDVGNYELFETGNPSNVIPILIAARHLDEIHVRLTLAEALSLGTSYTLRVTGVEDLHGRPIAPGSEIEFIANDTTPPELVRAEELSDTTVRLVFSERVDHVTAEDEANYGIFETADSSSTVIVTSAVLQPDSSKVVLTTAGPVEVGCEYTVTVENVEDLAGNPVPPGSEATFMIPDTYPPELVSVEMLNEQQIDVTFNEQLSAQTANDEGNYWLFETANPSDSLPIATAEIQGGLTTVRLTLVLPLTSGISHTLVVSDVTDLAGNPIEPGSEMEFIADDLWPPELAGAEALSDTTVEVEFSERVDHTTAEDEANYEIFETADSLNTVEIISAVLQADSSSVLLRTAVQMEVGSSYTVRVSNVEDLSGNPVSAGSEASFIIPDTYPPELVSVDVLESKKVAVNFSEQISGETSNYRTNYELFETDNPSEEVPISSAVRQPGYTKVKLYLDDYIIHGVSYTLRVSNIKDLAGNTIEPGSEIVFTVNDTIPPELTDATVPSELEVRLEFSEPLDSVTAQTAANYEVFETDDTLNTLPVIGAALLGDGTVVELSLGLPLGVGYYTIRVSNVEDLGGNPVPPGTSRNITYSGGLGCIGLYSDDAHSNWCVNGVGFYPVEMWVWCRPGALGQICAEFKVSYPVNTITSTVTYNDGIIYVVTGDLWNGVSVCYINCQWDWNWPFHQTIYVTDTTPTTVEIIPHPDAGGYYFANCEPGYPSEEIDICTNLFINCDNVPPEIYGVQVISSQIIDVLFNEDVSEETANDETNYELFETVNPLETVSITGAVLQSSGSRVRLTLAEHLAFGLSYTVSVTGVEDLEGLPIVPGSEMAFTANDMVRPVLTSAGSLAETLVEVGFSEKLDHLTAEDAANYDIVEAADTSSVIDVIGSVLQGDSMSVLLTAAAPMTAGVTYAVRVEDVEDLAGNAIYPGSMVEFTIPDTYPPELSSVEVLGSELVAVIFNEPVSAGTANDETNYELFETSNPSETISIAGASRQGDGITVRLTLAASLTFETSYTLRVSNVEDLSGNPIAPGSEIGFIPYDTFPPELAGAEAHSDTLVEVEFSERVDHTTAENAANYEIFRTADSTSTVQVLSAVIQADSSSVVLRTAVHMEVGSSYTVRVGNVEDLAGNPVPPGSEAAFIVPDTYPPELVSVEMIEPELVEVTFNEQVSSATANEETNYSLFVTGSPTDSIVIADAALQGGAVAVRLTLADSLTFEVSYTLRVSGVEDTSGNPITPGSEIVFVPHDIFPPELVEASRPSGYEVEVVFNEQLNSGTAENTSNYEIFELADSLSTISVTEAELAGGGSVVTLSLGDSLSEDVNYVLRVNDVEDLAGNPIATNSTYILYEMFAPYIVDVSLESMTSIVIVYSEPMDPLTAKDKSNYLLHETLDPSSVVNIYSTGEGSDSVTFFLYMYPSQRLDHETSYTLHVEDVEDMSGTEIAPGTEVEFTAYDTWPPGLSSAEGFNETLVKVLFNEPMDEASAENVSNYELFEQHDPSSTVSILSAELSTGGGYRVDLHLGSSLGLGVHYTVVVNNVQDVAGNAVPANTWRNFTYLPEGGYIGLYVDPDHSENEVWSDGGFIPFTYYVWCLPGEDGMICAEFAVSYSANIIQSTVTPNEPMISVSLGDLPSGMSVCMTYCHWDWVWTHSQLCYLTNSDVGYIEIVPHPDVGVYQLANCLPGYPVEPAGLMSKIYINEDSDPVATLLESFSATYKQLGIEVDWKLSRWEDDFEFIISRAEGEGGDFRELPVPDISRRDLEFSFVDLDVEAGVKYRYRIELRDGEDRVLLFETKPVDTPALPLTLRQNIPNPFNPVTKISYYLPEAGRVVLEVYDVSGRKVACLVDGHRQAGEHSIEWKGTDDAGVPVNSGVYFYRICTGKESISKKMVLLR